MPNFQFDDDELYSEDLEQLTLSETIERLIQSSELTIDEKEEQLKELLQYEKNICPDEVDRGSSKLSDKDKETLCDFSFIQSILELEKENIVLIELLINSGIVSSLDFIKLYNTALETQDQRFYDLTYRAASRLQHNVDADQLKQCFSRSFGENTDASSFQLLVLEIFATNPVVQKYMSIFFLSTIQENPLLAEFITKYIKINRDEENSIGQTALQLAAESGNTDLFRFLLDYSEHTKNLNKPLMKYYEYLSHRDQTRALRPVLFSIVQSPNYKEIFKEFHAYAERYVRSYGQDGERLYQKIFKARDEKGNTALTYLINRDLPDVLERLKFFTQNQAMLEATYSVRRDVHSDNNTENNVLDYLCKFYADTNQSKQIAEFLLSINLTSPEVAKKFPDLLYKKSSSLVRR